MKIYIVENCDDCEENFVEFITLDENKAREFLSKHGSMKIYPSGAEHVIRYIRVYEEDTAYPDYGHDIYHFDTTGEKLGKVEEL